MLTLGAFELDVIKGVNVVLAFLENVFFMYTWAVF